MIPNAIELSMYPPTSLYINHIQKSWTVDRSFQCERPNIFEYISVIENADEVHCMNSSYNWMIELMKIGNPKKNFFHLDIAHKYYGPRTVKTVFSDEVWTFI